MISDIEFRSFQEGDEPATAALFARAYPGRMMEVRTWRWRFVENPVGETVVELAFSGDRLVAHYAVTPVSVFIAGQRKRAALSGTTMTDPEFSGRGLFPALAKRAYERLSSRHYAFAYGFPNMNSHRGFIRDLAWRDVWEVPIFRLDIASFRSTLSRSTASREVGWDDALAKGFEPDPIQGVGLVRDRAFLSWRYQRNPSQRYRVLSNGDGGLLVFKRYKDELQIMELLSSDQQRFDLVDALVRKAKGEGCASVGMWLNLHDPLHRELERWGFENSMPITYLCAKALEPEFPAVIASYANWNISMGDSDVF
ncbi:MAG: GNAT family N-acetyltransferase [Deltaproteobacteria bacterium]|nr:GNAT family N-acetyltransferase [Deltaproteobacteria bacterium]